MSNKIKIDTSKLNKIREMDERLISYNVEMTEVTGGTFWKPYTKEQIDGTEQFPHVNGFAEMQKLMAMYKPIDLSNKRLAELTKALGPAYIRVSGSWASNTYYDFDGHTGGKPPEHFRAVLTKDQWDGVLDFAKEVDGKIQVSVANCEGVHNEDGTWNPKQAKLLFDYSKDYGVPIDSTEFMNEPNTYPMDGAPKNYSVEDFSRDQDAYFRFIRQNYPETTLVGPSAAGDKVTEKAQSIAFSLPSTESLLENCKETADVFSYHCYTGISERGASVIGGHWDVDDALSEEYLSVPAETCEYYAKLRDKHCVGAPMWITESADAGCGGNTWASTYLDVIRYADELGRFCTITDGAIFHNTLTSSDYGLLDHKDHMPRPSYWLAYIWSKLVGSTVYDTKEPIREGAHCFAHSRKDGKEGHIYIIVNNSKTESTFVDISVSAERYTLSAKSLRSSTVLLNGKPLELVGEYGLPELSPINEKAGTIEIMPATVIFLVF